MRLLLTLLILLSCEIARRQPLSRRGNIIGANEIVPVAVAQEARQVDAAVLSHSLGASALLVTAMGGRYRHCFGSLLPAADDRQRLRIITNRHCFAAAREPLPTSACARTRVYFNFSLPDTPLLERRCLRGSLRTHDSADLAIFTLPRELPSPHRPFTLWQGKIPVPREAFLLHYPHVIHSATAPARSVSRLSGTRLYFPIMAVSADGCVIKGRPKRGLWRLVPFGTAHSCDMTKGSSGAALIDFDTGKLLGISWGGLKLQVGKITQKVNFAVSADLVRKFLDHEPLHDEGLLKEALPAL